MMLPSSRFLLCLSLFVGAVVSTVASGSIPVVPAEEHPKSFSRKALVENLAVAGVAGAGVYPLIMGACSSACGTGIGGATATGVCATATGPLFPAAAATFLGCLLVLRELNWLNRDEQMVLDYWGTKRHELGPGFCLSPFTATGAKKRKAVTLLPGGCQFAHVGPAEPGQEGPGDKIMVRAGSVTVCVEFVCADSCLNWRCVSVGWAWGGSACSRSRKPRSHRYWWSVNGKISGRIVFSPPRRAEMTMRMRSLFFVNVNVRTICCFRRCLTSS